MLLSFAAGLVNKFARKVTIKGLVFDNGDVLFDAAVWRRWLAEYLRSRELNVSYDSLVDAWERQLVDVYRGVADYWDRFNNLMKSFGVRDDEVDAIIVLAKEKGREFQSQRTPMPHVRETLHRLRQRGIKLAVLSDSESGEAGVRGILSQLKIEEYFDTVISSRDIGAVKPDQEAFQYAIDKIGLRAADVGFVGHDIDELSGAIECQMIAIAYNYHPDAPANVYINCFSELLDVVSRGSSNEHPTA